MFLNIFDFGFSLLELRDKNLLHVINKLEGKVENLNNAKSNASSNSLMKKFVSKKIPKINAKIPNINAKIHMSQITKNHKYLHELSSSNCGENFFKEIFF